MCNNSDIRKYLVKAVLISIGINTIIFGLIKTDFLYPCLATLAIAFVSSVKINKVWANKEKLTMYT